MKTSYGPMHITYRMYRLATGHNVTDRQTDDNMMPKAIADRTNRLQKYM